MHSQLCYGLELVGRLPYKLANWLGAYKLREGGPQFLSRPLDPTGQDGGVGHGLVLHRGSCTWKGRT